MLAELPPARAGQEGPREPLPRDEVNVPALRAGVLHWGRLEPSTATRRTAVLWIPWSNSSGNGLAGAHAGKAVSVDSSPNPGMQLCAVILSLLLMLLVVALRQARSCCWRPGAGGCVDRCRPLQRACGGCCA